MMYGPAAIMIGHQSVAPTVQDSLYTPERHLFYLAMETFIYQYRKSIGMLSAYAEPFYLPTEENKYTEETKNEESEQKNEIEKKSDTKKDKTGQNNNHLGRKENTPIGEVNEIKEEEWVTVKRNERTKVVREAKQEEDNKSAMNQYTVIKEDKEIFDKKDDEKKLPAEVVQDKEDEEKTPVIKTEVLDKRRAYNIDEISLDEMVKHINEYNEKDNNAKALKDKMNVKSDNSNYRKTSSYLSFGTKEKKNDNIIVDIDSGSNGETDDDETTTDDDDFMIDDDDSVDYHTIEDLNEEDRLYVEGLKDAGEITVNGYQNNLLLFRLEQAEDKEERLLKELKAMEKESTEKAEKIAALESALKKKTELLLNELRNKR